MRRASIDRINARYRGTAAVSPVAHGVRTSVVRGASPVAPYTGVTTVAPAVFGRTSLIGGRGAVVGRGTSVVGAPIIGATYAPSVVTGGVIRNSTIAAGGYGVRGSTVVSAPVYQAVEHPPVYEAVTTPGRVYEIVTPVVEVTPDTVVKTDVVTVDLK